MKAHTSTQRANIAQLVYDTQKKPGDGSSRYARTEIKNASNKTKKRIQSELGCTMLIEEPGEKQMRCQEKYEKAYGVCIMVEG
jgi:hypothetical protein